MINEIRKAILDFIDTQRAVTGSRFEQIKGLMIGDPYLFAMSELPAICIKGTDGLVKARGTEYDTQTRTMELIVIVNIKTTLGALNTERVEWDYNLADLVE